MANVLVKILFGLMLVVVVPFGCFMVAGLMTGAVLGTLDLLGVHWSDTVFWIVTIPVAIVVGVWSFIHRDDLSDW